MTPEDHPLARLLGPYFQPHLRRTNGAATPTPAPHPAPHPAVPPAGDGAAHWQYAHAALLAECDQVRRTAEGARNHQLNTSAFNLGQIVGAGILAEHTATDALMAAGLACGLLLTEVTATVRSGLAAGMRQPRVIEDRDRDTYTALPDTTIDLAGTSPTSPRTAGEVGEVGENPQAAGQSTSPDEPGEVGALELRERMFEHEVEHELRRMLIRDEARRRRAQQQRAAGAQRPPRVRLDTALLAPDVETPWLIHGWLPAAGRTLLAAQYKAGKTTLVANLLRCLVDGDDWLGRYPVTPVDGTVAVLDLEMHPGQLVGWLRDQNIRHPERVLLIPARGGLAHLDLTDPEVRAEWANQMRGEGVVFLILDCLRPLMDALGLDEHSDAGQILVALDALLAEAGILGALVVHHMGHTGERSRGDSRIRDWPDVEWRLVRENDSPDSTRYLSAFGRDVDQSEAQLGYNSLTRHLSILDGNRRDAMARTILVDVLAVLDESPDALSLNQIEHALVDSDHTRKELRSAIELGVARHVLTRRAGPRGAKLHLRAAGKNTSTSPGF
jgi:hypothetical protein